MSKIGNHVVELQESPDYQRGWELAETGEFYPREASEAFRLGWNAYFNEADAA